MSTRQNHHQPPLVLCISGHDPTGGAGIQADIEAVAARGARAVTLVTALTLQDTHQVKAFQCVDPGFLLQQGRSLLAELPVAAVKIGMLGNEEILSVVVELLRDCMAIPRIVDPVLAGGGGGLLTGSSMVEAIREQLLPLTTLLTPNAPELAALAGGLEAPDLAAGFLIEQGCKQVLVTGTHNPGAQVINTLYDDKGLVAEWAWPRLARSFHGSGCTLAAAIAAELAKGFNSKEASAIAQQYCIETLTAGYQPANGQYFPNRFPA